MDERDWGVRLEGRKEKGIRAVVEEGASEPGPGCD